MTRSEIEQKLIAIVRHEKPDLPQDKQTPETALADAGIDSLDALTILFAIEEEFKIAVPDDKLTAATPLAEAGIDSLDALSILFAIEEEFHVSIPDEQARAMKTFGDMIDIVEGLVSG